MTNLTHKKCVPCEGETPPLTHDEAQKLLKEAPGWKLIEDALPPMKITREFKLKNFKDAIAFVNRIAALAEEQGHHPNIRLYSWNKVQLEFYTHKIGGLSENDFIMAAKVNELIASSEQEV